MHKLPLNQKLILVSFRTIVTSILTILLAFFVISFPKIKSNLSKSLAVTPTRSGIDIDVTYIERTPRYYRYDVIYSNNIPSLRPGTESNKRWPSVGETITYKAHIKNKGTASTTTFSYKWSVDGEPVNTGTYQNPIAPGAEVTFQYQMAWTGIRQSVIFAADTTASIAEISENNNQRTIGSNDLTISIWAEQGIYDIFNNTLNSTGSFSFEDWIWDHFEKMNQKLSVSRYPVAESGMLDRVRIDKIVIAPELDGTNSPMRTDPDINLIDGRWQFTDNDPTNQRGTGGEWQNYVNTFAANTDWGLIHELTHQLGAIDLYRMNLMNNPSANNGVHVLDDNGSQIPVSQLPTYAWNQILFAHPGIMGGGDTSPYNSTSYYESHSVAGLNTNQGKRRGFYGEYLYDTPQITSLKMLDRNGIPIGNAAVSIYQKGFDEIIDNTPEITGATDSQGVIQLPNRPVTPVTTATGHTLRDNPFGQISVVGQNGTMLLKVKKSGIAGYGWFLLHDLNLSYWSGNRQSAIIPISTNFSPALTPTGVRKPGDVDGNNLVNLIDFQLLSNTFGKISGQPGYDARADFDTSGTITILDFQILSNNFGR